MSEIVLPLLFASFVLWIVYLIFALVGDMAVDRGHSPWPWWLISIFWSPFGSMFILWLFFPKVDSKDEP